MFRINWERVPLFAAYIALAFCLANLLHGVFGLTYPMAIAGAMFLTVQLQKVLAKAAERQAQEKIAKDEAAEQVRLMKEGGKKKA